MRYLVALFFPWISFFTMGKVLQGLLCLVLQCTLIGWLPATIWAFVSISGYHADKRNERLVQAIESGQPPASHSPSVQTPPPVRAPAPRPNADFPTNQRPGPDFSALLAASPTMKSQARERVTDPPKDLEPDRRSAAYDVRKWRALIRFDDDIAAAAATLRAFGDRWEDELARAYLQLNDKSYLSAIVQKLTSEAQTQRA